MSGDIPKGLGDRVLKLGVGRKSPHSSFSLLISNSCYSLFIPHFSYKTTTAAAGISQKIGKILIDIASTGQQLNQGGKVQGKKQEKSAHLID